MKRYDFDADTISPVFNVWGPQRDSDPGLMSVVFDHGENLGDIEIDRMVRVFRSSTLYEAKRMVLGKGRGAGLKEERILLKVAHNNAAELIKREAMLLAKLNRERQHPMLPMLLPAHQFDEGQQRPYGKTTYQGEIKYYIVLKHTEGDFVRDMLLRNPQPWYRHAAWLTIQLADAVHFVHVKGQHLVLNISPDSVMIRTDVDGIPRPTLLDLGVVADPNALDPSSLIPFIPPSYVAPELLEGAAGGPFGAQTDVYGLGLLIYEMLAGQPAYPFKLRDPEDIRASVRRDMPPPMNRTDLAGDIAIIINQSIDKAPARRLTDVRAFAKELRSRFGEVPAERPKRRFPRRVVAGAVVLLFLVVAWTAIMAFTRAGL